MCLPLDECCCCLSLDVGTKITSIFSTVTSAAIALLYGATAALQRHQNSKTLFYGALAFTSGVQCVLGCALVCGAFLRKPHLMCPWVVVSWGQSALLMVLSIAALAVFVAQGGYDVATDTNAMITVYIVYSAFLFYCASVVHSRRAQLVREQAYASNRPVRSSDAIYRHV